MVIVRQRLAALALTPFALAQGLGLVALLPLSAQAQVEVVPEAAPVVPVQPINPVVEVPAAPVVIDPVVVDPAPEAVVVPSAPAVQGSTTAPAPNRETPVRVQANPGQTSGTYIDSTQYNLGATTAPEAGAPAPQIVLNERMTGCQAVLIPGQALPSSVCDRPAVAENRSGRGWIARGETLPNPGYGGYGSTGSGSYGGRGQLPVAYPGSGRTFDLAAYLPRLGGGGMAMFPNGKQMRFPLALPAPLTSAFGWRLHPISGTWRFHNGVDVGAAMGTPVVAVYPGQVAAANNLGGYGLTVILSHPKQQWETLYAHLSEILVQPGQGVRQGEIIGRVGSTGFSTGPHLHFEILQATENGPVAVNPGPYLQFAMADLIQALRTAQAKPVAAAKPRS